MDLTTRTRLGLLLAPGMLVLGACGQSGPLYLPGNPSEVQVETPPPEAATDEIIEEPVEDAPVGSERAEDDENDARE